MLHRMYLFLSNFTQHKASITKLCPKQVNKLLYMDAHIYYLAIKRNQELIHAAI